MGESDGQFYPCYRERSVGGALAWLMAPSLLYCLAFLLLGDRITLLLAALMASIILGIAVRARSLSTRLHGVLLHADGITVVPFQGPRRPYTWADVGALSAGERGAAVVLAREVLDLEEEFDEPSRLAIVRAVQLGVRSLGVGSEEQDVPPERIQDWLDLNPGQHRYCYCAWGRWLGEIVATGVGMDVRAWPRRIFVPWSDVRDLRFVPGRTPAGNCWRVVHEHGQFLFESAWINAGLLAETIERVLAERSVGHRLPGAAEASAPAGAISVADTSPPSAERGISFQDDGPEQPSR